MEGWSLEMASDQGMEVIAGKNLFHICQKQSAEGLNIRVLTERDDRREGQVV
jgi:hypothetical protein